MHITTKNLFRHIEQSSVKNVFTQVELSIIKDMDAIKSFQKSTIFG